MSVARISLRRHILSRRNDSKIAQKLEFLAPPDFDGDDSFHDHDNSVDSSDPNSSPSAGSERYDEPSSDFLDIDFPCTPSPIVSPYLMRKTRTLRSRKLQLSAGDDDGETVESRVPSSDSPFVIIPCATPSPVSPPHRKLRALRLFDTPQTPKTLLEKANKRTSSSLRPRRTRKCTHSAEKEDRPQANVNPFTPDNVLAAGCKRARTEVKRPILDESTESELEDEVPITKKIALHEINTSRYNEEFHEVCKLGDGEFGSVHNCVHRLDGCTYAIKKSKTPVAGSIYERTAMNEVYAHAVLGKHRHVVRYYSAWAENDYMYIQNEFCNGGSLADLVEDRRQTGRKFSETELKTLLFQLAKGLKYIHSQNLVHLDVKPGNVFIHRDPKYSSSAESGLDSCDDDDEQAEDDGITYKIGDLGHVTSCTNPMVEDGDCRYLPREILDENYDYLTKSDIFSLGLTVYEVASGRELPKNGDEWHALREGQLPYLPHYSVEFNSLLKSMVSKELSLRPSASGLLQESQLCPQSRMTREQLRRELNQERFKNQMLTKQLSEATRCLHQQLSLPHLACTPPQLSTSPHLPTSLRSTPRTNHHRLIGGRLSRSLSMTLL